MIPAYTEGIFHGRSWAWSKEDSHILMIENVKVLMNHKVFVCCAPTPTHVIVRDTDCTELLSNIESKVFPIFFERMVTNAHAPFSLIKTNHKLHVA